MQAYRNWLLKCFIAFFSLTLLLGLPIMLFNYIVDPLWLFEHKNKWNNIQQGFNERQQKVNRFTFTDEPYDALLIGSSRSTYINQHHFKNLNVFNFAVSSMYVDEYKDYIEYAKKQNGKDFKFIFLGLDFFATNKYRTLNEKEPSYYTEQAESYLYRLKSLASFDTLKLSVPIYKSSQEDKPTFIDHRYYNRENVAFPFPVTDQERQARIETNIYQFFRDEPKYEYDPAVIQMLEEIVKTNSNTIIVPFTTPVTLARLNIQLENEEYMQGYEQWLKDLTGLFDKVYHFMDINQVSLNVENFTDSHHFTPEIGNQIVDEIWNDESKEDLSFGRVLTASNVESEIINIKTDINEASDYTYDFLKPLEKEPFFTDDFSQIKKTTFSTEQWDESLSPLTLLGAKGSFNMTVNDRQLLVEPPTKLMGTEVIQLGFDYANLNKGNVQDEVTFIVSLKGNVSSSGSVQLFIQDQVNKEWERATYNPILDPHQTRSFKVSKKIRGNAEKILFGVRWQNIKNEDEWIIIDKVSAY
ncbi:hypothetical protein ACFYKX_14010 [Cytobacillus sp. FJAT-54145]|uniref:Uncharacterized protein n=1 Tax=Cytobacillus spartinae TaxID=3299023 RepID=A0ABW6KFQ5_9BACI